MKTRIALTLALALALVATASATDRKSEPKKRGAESVESKFRAEGRSSGLLDEEKARLEAINAALDEAAKKLEERGYGKRVKIRDDLRLVFIEKKVLSRDDFSEFSIDSVCQERLPTDRDGQNAKWSVQVSISLRLKKAPAK